MDALRPLRSASRRRAGFAAVKAPKLGVWQKSAPGRASSGFVFTKRVEGLTAPARYRAQVRFRWYGAGGSCCARPRARRATCKQPDQRPDLRAGAVDAAPRAAARPGHLRRSTSATTARTAAGPFDVVLTVGGAEQPPEHGRRGLAPGATRAPSTFVGAALHAAARRCASTLDADRTRVDESERGRRRSSSAPARLQPSTPRGRLAATLD